MPYMPSFFLMVRGYSQNFKLARPLSPNTYPTLNRHIFLSFVCQKTTKVKFIAVSSLALDLKYKTKTKTFRPRKVSLAPFEWGKRENDCVVPRSNSLRGSPKIWLWTKNMILEPVWDFIAHYCSNSVCRGERDKRHLSDGPIITPLTVARGLGRTEFGDMSVWFILRKESRHRAWQQSRYLFILRHYSCNFPRLFSMAFNRVLL